MKNFAHVNATSTASSVALLDVDGNSKVIAGGTDLLTEMKLGIISPERLVNLKTVSGLDHIDFDRRNGLRLGALATLDEIAAKNFIRQRFAVLFKAISVSGTPQLRNQGTIGGNLNQDSRCWYYRGEFHCWLKGGELCYAGDGENVNHAIFGGGPCYMVHPSDPAPALVALDAKVRLAGPTGERILPLEQFFQVPREGARKLTVIRPNEIVVEIIISTPASGSHGIYLKARARRAWSFALSSIAAQIEMADNRVRDARLVLGGVAPRPWRLDEVEDILRGRRLDEKTIEKAAELAVKGARPLSKNSYKIPLVKGILKEALNTLRA